MPLRRWLVPAAVMAAALVAAVTDAPTGATPSRSACTPRWRLVAHAGVPPLAAVAALSSTDVWAVGGSDFWAKPWAPRAVIVHWDGRALHTQPFPWKNAEFNGVAATSPSDVWAVGGISHTTKNSSWDTPVAVHWDGRTWKRAELPTTVGALGDVAAIAADDVWAVGSRSAGDRPLVLHWNGRAWRRIDMLGIAPSGSDLRAVAAASGHDVWAVGAQNLGASSSYGYMDLVLRWDGRRWLEVPSPLNHEMGSGPYAGSVSISPSGEVWTVNSDMSGNGPYFVHWSGSTRSTTHVSDWDIYPVLQSVYDIAAVSKTRVWAVGIIDYDKRGEEADTPLVGYWNGASWHLQHTPFDTLRRAPLYGISAVSPTDIWAVGNHVVARYSC